jgi:hypothetical protein
MYYACEAAGGTPGLEDPLMMADYACPDIELNAGDPCGDIDNLGCCDAVGDNWYCDNGTLFLEECS